MLFFAASTNLCCRIFAHANKKFICVFVRVFYKIRFHRVPLLQIQLQIGTLSASNHFGLVLYDVMDYNDVMSAQTRISQ